MIDSSSSNKRTLSDMVAELKNELNELRKPNKKCDDDTKDCNPSSVGTNFLMDASIRDGFIIFNTGGIINSFCVNRQSSNGRYIELLDANGNTAWVEAENIDVIDFIDD